MEGMLQPQIQHRFRIVVDIIGHEMTELTKQISKARVDLANRRIHLTVDTALTKHNIINNHLELLCRKSDCNLQVQFLTGTAAPNDISAIDFFRNVQAEKCEYDVDYGCGEHVRYNIVLKYGSYYSQDITEVEHVNKKDVQQEEKVVDDE